MRRISIACFVALVCGVNTASVPAATETLASAAPTAVVDAPGGAGLATTFATADLPEWVLNPATVPHGLQGQNNCTFAFGQNAQWDFHPDGACWEHSAPDGLTRQQLHNVHFPTATFCGGGPGDSSAIRVCGTPGAETVCGKTGPNGCAVCVPQTSCH